MKAMVKLKHLISMVLALVFLFSTFTSASAFKTQGIVTGRLYNELSTNLTAFQEFQDLKLGWIRIEFEEFYGVPAGSTFTSAAVQANKTKFQQVIANAHSKGLKVLGVIANSAIPDIPNFPNTDASIQSFKSAVQWHLDNYNVDAIQIWNEPSANVKFTNTNLARYAKTLIEVYALKPQYPNVKFVGPATANAEAGVWLGQHGYGYDPENSIFNSTIMLNYRAANNGKLPLDVISWHPYGTQGDPNGNFYFGRTFATYYNEIKAYTDVTGRNVIGSYPIWFTEYGWDANLVGEENQRIYTERMIGLIYARPQIEIPFLYGFRDDEDGPGTEDKAFGIRKNSLFGYAKKRVFYPFASHSSIVGLFTQDGVNEWTVDQIIDKYLSSGGRAAYGDAYRHSNAPWYGDKAHYWGPGNNGIIQQFNNGSYGECGILLKVGAANAYLLKGGFYTFYVNNNGPYAYGWPTSDEYYDSATGYVMQKFENGKLRWKSGEAVTWVSN
ncbi:hypothetical protein [Paenibacillus gansuensis]|uniref:Glycoside hydrolase family 5 domain-containing protein n=1 Tax=Paenibacillus gansuensis TaxID=306542 RepID=A0ABW5PE96_9BACL